MILKQWEKINKQTHRMWIPEGWIVKEYSMDHVQMVIVNDPTHEWDKKEEKTLAERKISHYTKSIKKEE